MSAKLDELFEICAEARRDGFIKMKELKERGEKLCGIFCLYTPEEIIAAAGAHQVGLCGSSQASIPSAEKVLPANLCPLIKSSYGHALDGTCPYAFFSDFVVGETTCDGKKKMYELLSELKPMHVLHLPNVPDYERSLEMWANELRIFKDKMEEVFDVTITDDMLNEEIEKSNRIREQIVRLYELGRYEPPAITGAQMQKVSNGTSHIFNTQQRHDLLKEIVDICEDNWKNGQAPWPVDTNRPRILISGSGSGGISEKVIPVIEESGAAIVCYEGCGGVASRRRNVDEDRSRDPFIRLAEKYIEVPCAVMSPNTIRMEQVRGILKEWNVDGVVCTNLHSCNPFAVESEHIRRVAEELGIPALHIQSDFSTGDEGQIRTRIEAFVEMLKDKKQAL